MHAAQPFDVVHHLTFANIWLPALVIIPNVPFVLGPVGGGPSVPVRFWGMLGLRGATAEVWLRSTRRICGLLPPVRRSWYRADYILAQNRETLDALPSGVRRRAVVRPHACIPDGLPRRSAQPSANQIVLAARLVPWKGMALLVSTMRRLPSTNLISDRSGPGRAASSPTGSGLGRVRPGRVCSVASAKYFVGTNGTDRNGRDPELARRCSAYVAEAIGMGARIIGLRQGGSLYWERQLGDRLRLVSMTHPVETEQLLAEAITDVGSVSKITAPPQGMTRTGIARELQEIYGGAFLTRTARPPTGERSI